jgi:hypothetical protein
MSVIILQLARRRIAEDLNRQVPAFSLFRSADYPVGVVSSFISDT